MKSYSWVSLVRCVLVISLFSSPCVAQLKPRIAVYPFDDRTSAKPDLKIGTKVADALISKLTANGAFIVYDREYLNQLLKEKNVKYDPNFDSSTAGKSGLLGTVDFVVYGQVDAFNVNTRSMESGPMWKRITETDGIVNLKVTARVLSVEKGSILIAPSANIEQTGELSKTTNNALINNTQIKGQQSQIGNTSALGNKEQALLKLVDEASEEVTQRLIPPIAQSAETFKPQPAPTPLPSGPSATEISLAGVKGGLAYIDQGSDAGIKKGQKFAIYRSVDTGLKNRKGESLLQDNSVCNLSVTIVNKNSAAGKCTPDPTVHGPDGVPLVSDKVVPAGEK